MKVNYTEYDEYPDDGKQVYVSPSPAEDVHTASYDYSSEKWFYLSGAGSEECEVDKWAYIEEPDVFEEKISQSNLILKKFKSERENKYCTNQGLSVEYILSHNNGKTNISHTLLLKRDEGRLWTASVGLSDIDPLEKPEDAISKLSDWMGRLSIALKDKAKDCANINLKEI